MVCVDVPRSLEALESVRPVALAEERLLPVLPTLSGLLPGGGLRRGSTVAVAGGTSLALALLAGPSAAGSWAAVVGVPALGLVAAAEAGVAVDRLGLVPAPGTEWPAVVAALLDALDVVVVRVPDRAVRAADARRLAARARERGTVVVLAGRPAVAAWPEGPDLQLTLGDPGWEGLGPGHGHLQRRRVHLEVSGRREAARPRAADLWLPAAVDVVAPAEPAAPDLRVVTTPTVGELVRAAS